jgi:tRNA uridine 5-carboxymethylaminomethyl modification enzyme
MGLTTLLLTISIDQVAHMSCNPAIGGIAKGHLVKEIDALGGLMAMAIDATGIQFRRLNTKKGPAVRSSRAQADMYLYKTWVRETLEAQDRLHIKQGLVEGFLTDDANGSKKIAGVFTQAGEEYLSDSGSTLETPCTQPVGPGSRQLYRCHNPCPDWVSRWEG